MPRTSVAPEGSIGRSDDGKRWSSTWHTCSLISPSESVVTGHIVRIFHLMMAITLITFRPSPFLPQRTMSQLSATLTHTATDAPTCKESQKSSYGASIGETIAISCDVESSPSPSMFYWIFHTSLPGTATPDSASLPAVTGSHLFPQITTTGTSDFAASLSTKHNPTSDLSSASSALPLQQKGGSSSISQSLVSSSSKAAIKSSTTSSSSRNRSHSSSSSSRSWKDGSQSPDPNPRINSRNSASNSLATDIHNRNGSSSTSGSQIGVSYSKLKYVSDGNRSWLYLTPKSKADFGTVECWATNGIGKQRDACTFTVYPAGESSAVSVAVVS